MTLKSMELIDPIDTICAKINQNTLYVFMSIVVKRLYGVLPIVTLTFNLWHLK